MASIFRCRYGQRKRMPPYVHPCLCGFTCKSRYTMSKHRKTCALWQTRPEPERYTRERRERTNEARKDLPPMGRVICIECRRRNDRHAPDCSFHPAEISRKLVPYTYDIDPFAFDVVLKLLAKRYRKRNPTE